MSKVRTDGRKERTDIRFSLTGWNHFVEEKETRGQQRGYNDIACPSCQHELRDEAGLGITLSTKPTCRVTCDECGWKGDRRVFHRG